MTAVEIAGVCHEANRAFCRAIGDMSQPTWEDAPGWQRTSAVNGVEAHLATPGMGANHSHNLWYDEKSAAGWVYGPVKDPEKKEHPCMVAFEDLPPEQQAKDHLFKGIVHALSRLVP